MPGKGEEQEKQHAWMYWKRNSKCKGGPGAREKGLGTVRVS